jgi:hypothetical protein
MHDNHTTCHIPYYQYLKGNTHVTGTFAWYSYIVRVRERAQVDLYGKIKTPPKRRTQNWHLSNAAWAPSGHTQNHRVSMWIMACVWCSYDRARGYESRGFKTLCLPSAPYAQRLVTSTVALAAVVVELEPEARTGSRRSIMTDDSRPNHPPAAWSAVMQRMFLYGQVKTPPE